MAKSATATRKRIEKVRQETREQIEHDARVRAQVEAEMRQKYAKKRIQRTPSPEEVAVQADIAEGRVMDVKFTNHLDEGADVHFVHGGFDCHFFDGREYKDIPITVINFVNSKMFPNDSYEVDPETRMIKRTKKGYKPRCGLVPTNIDLAAVAKMKQAASDKLAKKKTPDAKPPAEG